MSVVHFDGKGGKKNKHHHLKDHRGRAEDDNNNNNNGEGEDDGDNDDNENNDDNTTAGYTEIERLLKSSIDQLLEKRSSTRIAAYTNINSLLRGNYLEDVLINHQESLKLSIINSIRKNDSTEEFNGAITSLLLFFIQEGGYADYDQMEKLFNNIRSLLLDYAMNYSKIIENRRLCIEALGIGGFLSLDGSISIIELLSSLAKIFSPSAGALMREEKTTDNNNNNNGSSPILASSSSGTHKFPDLLISQSIQSFSLIATNLSSSILCEKLLPQYLPLFRSLLHHDSLAVRAAAGEAIALLMSSYFSIYKINNDGEGGGDSDQEPPPTTLAESAESMINESLSSLSLAEAKRLSLTIKKNQQKPSAAKSLLTEEYHKDLIELIELLSKESDRSQTKRDRSLQRAVFRDIFATVKTGAIPIDSLTISKQKFEFIGWSKLIQLAALREILGAGLIIHFKKNPLLEQIFNIYIEDEDIIDESLDRAAKKAASKAREKSSFKEINKLRKKKNAFVREQFEDDS